MKHFSLKVLVCFALICLLFGFSAFAEESKNATTEQINVIKLLEIANGDTNGNMNFEKNVSRAEFVKMVISASPNKDLAANSKLNISLFPDVKNNYWGAGYISAAINSGLVTGYIDGTFKPTNNVTLEEAATIVLRLLGYSDSDFIGSYPTAQLMKYEDLGLDESIDAVRGDLMTRENCMLLLYNALSAKTKSGAIYCTTLGYSANSDGNLEYSSLLEEKLDGPIIVSDTSNIFEGTKFSENEKTKYVLNDAKASKSSIVKDDVVYFSDVINTVFVYRKTATGVVTSSNNSSVTLGTKQYSIATAAAKSKLSLGGTFSEEKSFVTLVLGVNDGVIDVLPGSIDKIDDNADNASHISMIDATISKAVYIKDANMANSWKSYIPFDADNAIVYSNGNKTTTPVINANDVIYYSKQFNSVWIYKKTVSGNIEAITPASSPSSVTVSGKTYQVASSSAQYDLSVYGSYEVGDRVTLILGINDECISVSDAAITNGLFYGVITDLGEKVYVDKNGDEYTAEYVTVTDTSASSFTYEYRTKNFRLGEAVKVAVSDKIGISKISDEISRGEAARLSEAMREGKFAEGCEIIDVRDSQVIKVRPDRITGVELDAGQFTYSTVALYWEFDDNGNLTKLILKNFTGDIDDYGVVTSSTKGKITYKIDGNERTVSTDGADCSVGPAKLIKTSGTITSATTLTGVLENVETITGSKIYDTKGIEYELSDDIKVFVKNGSYYEYSSVSDIIASGYKLTAYYDKLPVYGGRIRVIIAHKFS